MKKKTLGSQNRNERKQTLEGTRNSLSWSEGQVWNPAQTETCGGWDNERVSQIYLLDVLVPSTPSQ